MIDFKIRVKNPTFWVSVVLSIATPIMMYQGLTAQDFTTWGSVGKSMTQAISNPYVLVMAVVSLYNTVLNPLTKGIQD